MINLFLGIGMLILNGIIVWSYIYDPHNSLVVSFSKKQYIFILIVLSILMIYLLSTGIYYSFL